jgi:hypothetical protein
MRSQAAVLLASTFVLSVAAPAMAQDADARRSARSSEGIVREVNKGLYLKSGVGVTPFFATNSIGNPIVSPVMTVDLSVGNDIVDNERLSMAVEAQFGQQLHQGPKPEDLAAEAAVGAPFLVSGDLHVFALTATYEVSIYPTRRLGVGVRGGGGVSIVPLLMNDQYYQELIVPNYGVDAVIHRGPNPTVRAGATLEYYTKLSHFSVGTDIDVLYVIGSLGLGLSPTGYLKYTF